ncbi:MAG: hypothetical protein JO262_11175 [Solirubrobacterales bacterium]|nr:hypothetical protein [Solirubrobacterales bacterium]MBV9942679.1 hypothetical protein [Solirubrobacterales bacterium]
MTQPRDDIQPALAHLEVALEASCATLVALEAIKAEVRDAPLVEAQLDDAIASLREAIAAIRAVHGANAAALALGFVLEADEGWAQARSGQRRARRRQWRPRRTA